jgi:predicted membrane protein
LQFGVGSVLPICVLTLLIWHGTTGNKLVTAVFASAFLVLLAVLMMRWNVVIGGQEISKTGRGLLAYQPPIIDREGLLAAGIVLVMPFILLLGMVRLFRPWEEDTTSGFAVAR